jgi:hypothetical protein
MATDNSGLRVWAAAFALGLALAGPQAGVAAADRGNASDGPAAAGEDGAATPGEVRQARSSSDEVEPEAVAVELEPELTPEPKIHIDPGFEEPPVGTVDPVEAPTDETTVEPSPLPIIAGPCEVWSPEGPVEELAVEPTTGGLTEETGIDEAGIDEAGTDETGTDETGTDETGTDETGTDETGTDETGTDETGTDETGTDETGTDETGTDETGTDETGTDETGTDETGTDETGTDEPTLVDKVGEGPEPLRPEPQPWWRTTVVPAEGGEELLGGPVSVFVIASPEGPKPSELPGVEWYYDTLTVDAPGENGTDLAPTDSPPVLTSTTAAVGNQALDTLRVQVLQAVDQIAELLSSLPANPFSDFISGALLLLRRALQPETLVRSDTDSGTSLDDPQDVSPRGLIGLTEDEAVQAAEAAGLVSRVVSRDGTQFPITKDYRLSRLNLTVNDGLVTAVYVG